MKKAFVKLGLALSIISLVYSVSPTTSSAEEIGIGNAGSIGDWPWEPHFLEGEGNMAMIIEIYNENGGNPPPGYASWQAYGEAEGAMT